MNFRIKLILTGAMLFLVSCGYNAMQAQEETVFRAWADLESQIQRRSDLIPNLTATVKGAAAMEQGNADAGDPGPCRSHKSDADAFRFIGSG